MNHKSKKLYLITGPSGVGKSTVASRLAFERSIDEVVSTTTRSRRAGENDGIEYHFIDPRRGEEMIENGSFFEFTRYDGHIYGTTREAIRHALRESDEAIIVVDSAGAKSIRERLGEFSEWSVQAYSFLLIANRRILERRMKERGDSEEQIEKRLTTYQDEVFQPWEDYTAVIFQNKVENTVQQLDGLIDLLRGRHG